MLLRSWVRAQVFAWRVLDRIRDERGQTMTEYGVLAAILVVGVLGAVYLLRDRIIGVFNRISNALQ